MDSNSSIGTDEVAEYLGIGKLKLYELTRARPLEGGKQGDR